MPRKSPLNENEKGQISANKLKRKSINSISRELSRSRPVVRNYLKDPESYGARKRPKTYKRNQMSNFSISF